MHGLNLASRSAGRPLLCSPPAPLGAEGSQLRSTSASQPGRSRCLGSAFRSPATSIRCRTASTGSPLPAIPFVHPAGPSSDPFGLRLPSSRCSQRGEDRHRLPVARLLPGSPTAIPDFRSPSGVFVPTGSPFPSVPAAGSLPWRSARSPFAPRRQRLLVRPPSDHRSRSAASRPAHCSVNLLEPPL